MRDVLYKTHPIWVKLINNYRYYCTIFVKIVISMVLMGYLVNRDSPNEVIKMPYLKDQKYLYLIDTGHGVGTKCGANSVETPDGCWWEWEYCYDIANILCKKMDKVNLKYIRVNPHPDQNNLHPRDRIKIINNIKRDVNTEIILISLHANASKNKKARGIEIYLKDTKFPNDSREQKFQRTIASILAKNFEQLLPQCEFRESKEGKPYFDSKKAKVGDVGILKQTANVYAVLTENGFFTNEEERNQMSTHAFKESVALVHFNTILELEN
jgi:N-acetylmuramoyl-L-alanine amidase